jgi:hypothetical protein
MLEGTDGKIHFVPYTPEIEQARSEASFGPIRSFAYAACSSMVHLRLKRKISGEPTTSSTIDSISIKPLGS